MIPLSLQKKTKRRGKGKGRDGGMQRGRKRGEIQPVISGPNWKREQGATWLGHLWPSIHTHAHTHGPAGVWGSGGVSPTLGQRPAPLSLSCGPVNEEVTYGLGTLVRQANREADTHTHIHAIMW